MKKSGLQKLTGLALAAMLAGGILAPAVRHGVEDPVVLVLQGAAH